MFNQKYLLIFILLVLIFFSSILFGDNNCLNFDGNNDFVNCGNYNDLNFTVPLTIEAWVKPSYKSTISTILSKKHDGAAYPGYAFFINGYNQPLGSVHFETKNANFTSVDGSVTNDEWQHIAIVIESVDENDDATGSIYVNGISQEFKDGEKKCNLMSSTTDIFTIGGFTSGTVFNFIGSLDEIRIWNIARTENEIRNNMGRQLAGDEEGLLVYYRLDEGSGDFTDNLVEPFDYQGWIYSASWISNNGLFLEDPLPIVLSSFTALATPTNLAQLIWETESESNLLGFNIYRSDSMNLDNSIQVNSQILEPNNSSIYHCYLFLDENVELDHIYSYWLESIELDGGIALFGPANVEITSTEFDENAPDVTIKAGLQSIYPNPFNPETTISYYLTESSEVTLEVYNLKGQIVKTFQEGYKEANINYSINWNAKDTNSKTNSSGIYFIKLKAGDLTEVRRAVLIK